MKGNALAHRKALMSSDPPAIPPAAPERTDLVPKGGKCQTPKAPRWYDRNVFVIIWLYIFFPVGLYGMWKGKRFSRSVRILVTLFFAVVGLMMYQADAQKRNGQVESSSSPASSDAPSTTSPTISSAAGSKTIPNDLPTLEKLHWAILDDRSRALEKHGFFLLMGKVTDRGDDSLLMFGSATPNEGTPQSAYGTNFENANIEVIDYQKGLDQYYQYQGRHYYIGKKYGKNSFGGSVPIYVYGPQPDDIRRIEERLISVKEAIAQKCTPILQSLQPRISRFSDRLKGMTDISSNRRMEYGLVSRVDWSAVSQPSQCVASLDTRFTSMSDASLFVACEHTFSLNDEVELTSFCSMTARFILAADADSDLSQESINTTSSHLADSLRETIKPDYKCEANGTNFKPFRLRSVEIKGTVLASESFVGKYANEPRRIVRLSFEVK